jgi:hypothetical protein
MLKIINTFISGALGDTAIFNDITGQTGPTAYGVNGNISIADVDAVRLKIANLLSMEAKQTLIAGQTFTQFKEYICTAGSGTVDSKGIAAGEYFVPQIAGLSVPSGMEFTETGYYVPQILNSWLPTATQVGLTMDLSQIGQTGNSLIEDSVYTLEYSVFIDSFTGTQAAVLDSTYMVLSSTASYDGNTYRAGEIFIAIDTSNIVTVGNVVILSSAKTSYFVIEYNILKEIFGMIPTASQMTKNALFRIRMELQALAYSCMTGNVSYTYAQGLLSRLNDEVIYLKNNN